MYLKFGRGMVGKISQKGGGREGGLWGDFQLAGPPGPAFGHGGQESEAVCTETKWAICNVLTESTCYLSEIQIELGALYFVWQP